MSEWSKRSKQGSERSDRKEAECAQTKCQEKSDCLCHFCLFLKMELFLLSALISKRLDLECCGLRHFKAISF